MEDYLKCGICQFCSQKFAVKLLTKYKFVAGIETVRCCVSCKAIICDPSFSPKSRLERELQERLYPFFCSVVKKDDMKKKMSLKDICCNVIVQEEYVLRQLLDFIDINQLDIIHSLRSALSLELKKPTVAKHVEILERWLDDASIIKAKSPSFKLSYLLTYKDMSDVRDFDYRLQKSKDDSEIVILNPAPIVTIPLSDDLMFDFEIDDE